MIQKKIKQDKLFFALNEVEKAASVIGHEPIREVFVPRSINYKDEEYIVKSILKGAFEDAKKMKSIQFPSNSEIEVIESYAFANSSITTITIPPCATKICEYTFNMCKYLQQIEFPPNSKIQIIEKDAFSESSIEQITIPSTITDLEDGWCSNTTKLNKVIIKPNNRYFMNIDDKMVIKRKDSKLDEYEVVSFVRRDIKTIQIPSFITTIGSFSFNCSAIESIVIPSQVTKIGDSAFHMCSKLKKVEFSENSQLEIIQEHAFTDTSIESISIPPHVTKICQKTFLNCDLLKNVYFPQNSELRTIESNAFYDSAIESLTIPSSVSDFQDCWANFVQNLTDIKILKNEEENIKLFNNEVIIGKSDLNSDNFDVLVFARRDIETIDIPSCIKVIGSTAFTSSHVGSISLPPQVTKINSNAFSYCQFLERFEIPFDSDLNVIENSAFTFSGIKSIVIPSGIEFIGRSCFLFCVDLEIIEISPNPRIQSLLNDIKESFSIYENVLLTIPAGSIKLNK